MESIPRPLALAVLCALSTFVVAAPAPKPGPWVRGWDRPIDPRGDCKFDRDGEKLTLTVPGKRGKDLLRGDPNAPRLLRDVKGDFAVVVRVGGTFRPTGENGWQQAGLLLTDGKNTVRAVRLAHRSPERAPYPLYVGMHHGALGGGANIFMPGPTLEKLAYLRLERRGNELRVSSSPDGKKWSPVNGPLGLRLPRKVKVGVIAESGSPGVFRAVFDQFRLSPLPGDGRPPR